VIEGNKNDIEKVVTELSDERLIIKQESWRFNLKEKVNIHITMPEVGRIERFGFREGRNT